MQRVFSSTQLKAVAASCIDYACVPLSKQADWAEVCWIIYMLALAFTEPWAEFKGKSWRTDVQDKQTAILLQLLVGGAERSPKAITRVVPKYVCVTHSSHCHDTPSSPESQLPPHLAGSFKTKAMSPPGGSLTYTPKLS